MEQNDYAHEISQLKKIGLPKEVYEILVLLFDQCYLKGRIRELNEKGKKFQDVINKFK